jgi:hypothetical protein
VDSVDYQVCFTKMHRGNVQLTKQGEGFTSYVHQMPTTSSDRAPPCGTASQLRLRPLTYRTRLLRWLRSRSSQRNVTQSILSETDVVGEGANGAHAL